MNHINLHQIRTRQRLPVDLKTAWGFFSNPRNLSKITPEALDFRVMNDPPPRIRKGAVIAYRIRPLLNIPVRWTTEITCVAKPHLFIDVQRRGPYRLWHHQHRFRDIDGGVEVEDVVHYALPLDLPGELIHRFIVRPRLEQIFAYRERVLERRYGRMPAAAQALRALRR